jgi:tRNA1(Val) A37 N6-methylase TrmN6
MRASGKLRMGYFPLPLAEASRIRGFFHWPEGEFSVIDPCAGCGGALAEITAGSKGVCYGIELDAFRAEEAAKALHHVIQGSCFDVHCPVESYSLAYVNPPYDYTGSERRGERAEGVFLEHTFRWLKPGGVLALVIPSPRLGTCADVLAVQFRDKAVYRLTDPEYVKYQQIVVFGARRSQRERSRLKDYEIHQAKQKLHDLARNHSSLPILPDQPDRVYSLPPSGLVNWAYRGMPLDPIEDLLPRSAAYRQATRILFAPPNEFKGRPLTPLHGGHTAIVAVSGMLDGIFGRGESRHVAAWNSVKVTDRFEEEEDGVITIRERERWSQGLTLIYANGLTAILTDGRKTS